MRPARNRIEFLDRGRNSTERKRDVSLFRSKTRGINIEMAERIERGTIDRRNGRFEFGEWRTLTGPEGVDKGTGVPGPGR
jgi:hypothetical protein